MIDTLSAAKSTANINTTACAVRPRRAGSHRQFMHIQNFRSRCMRFGCNQNHIVLVHLCACVAKSISIDSMESQNSFSHSHSHTHRAKHVLSTPMRLADSVTYTAHNEWRFVETFDVLRVQNSIFDGMRVSYGRDVINIHWVDCVIQFALRAAERASRERGGECLPRMRRRRAAAKT